MANTPDSSKTGDFTAVVVQGVADIMHTAGGVLAEHVPLLLQTYQNLLNDGVDPQTAAADSLDHVISVLKDDF